MAITPLVLPSTSQESSDYPSQVSVHPVAVASILDHHLRRPKHATPAGAPDQSGSGSGSSTEQDRVIGTLMGTRNEAGHVNILSSFGVPFGEVEGKLLLDTDALRQQLEIIVRASPKLSVVGWYATHPVLNSWTPLIHDEYANLAAAAATSSSTTSPTAQFGNSFSPVHLTLDVQTLAIRAYAGAKLGLAVDSSNRTFVPLKTDMSTAKSEQAGLEVLTKHALPMIRSDAPAQQASTQQLVAPLVSLQGMLQEVAGMVENVLAYVKQVNQGQVQGDPKIGRYLLETLASVPLASASKTSFDEDFNNHLADLLMVSYLANVVRVNIEIATRSAMLHDARLAPRAA